MRRFYLGILFIEAKLSSSYLARQPARILRGQVPMPATGRLVKSPTAMVINLVLFAFLCHVKLCAAPLRGRSCISGMTRLMTVAVSLWSEVTYVLLPHHTTIDVFHTVHAQRCWIVSSKVPFNTCFPAQKRAIVSTGITVRGGAVQHNKMSSAAFCVCV